MSAGHVKSLFRCLCVVPAATLAILAASAGVASAAYYDDYGYTGFMKTASDAVATVNMQCGRNGVLVLQAPRSPQPQYFSYKATSSTGVATGWMPWDNVSSVTQRTIISKPGYWWVEVQIAHYNGWGWYYDTESAPVSVQPEGYNHRFWCKVTG